MWRHALIRAVMLIGVIAHNDRKDACPPAINAYYATSFRFSGHDSWLFVDNSSVKFNNSLAISWFASPGALTSVIPHIYPGMISMQYIYVICFFSLFFYVATSHVEGEPFSKVKVDFPFLLRRPKRSAAIADGDFSQFYSANKIQRYKRITYTLRKKVLQSTFFGASGCHK